MLPCHGGTIDPVVLERNIAWIEAVSAVIVCREGHRVEEAELIAHARDRLAYYKVPKRIIFVDSLPRNASGKILKRELRRIHGETEAAFVTDAPQEP